MASKKHRLEEVVDKLRQVDVLVSQGQSVAEASTCWSATRRRRSGAPSSPSK